MVNKFIIVDQLEPPQAPQTTVFSIIIYSNCVCNNSTVYDWIVMKQPLSDDESFSSAIIRMTFELNSTNVFLFCIVQESSKMYFPGKVKVCFRKGPSGFLPSEEAKIIKNDPSLQVSSAPLNQIVVHRTAKQEVFNRGGDHTDKTEVLGEYKLQFGKYQGQTFRWTLENDVGYTLYLLQCVQKEKDAGLFVAEGHKKESLVSFLEYAESFEEIRSLLKYEAERSNAPPPAASPGDNLVGFGVRAKDSWKQVWDSRADGYAAFILSKKCTPGSKMYRLQQYLLEQQSKAPTLSASPLPRTQTPTLPATPSQSSGMSVLNIFIIKTIILM